MKKQEITEYVKWKAGVLVSGKFKKIFQNKFGKYNLILENDENDIIVNIPSVLLNKMRQGKNLIKVGVPIEIYCKGLVKNKYYDFDVKINNFEIKRDDAGLDLL